MSHYERLVLSCLSYFHDDFFTNILGSERFSYYTGYADSFKWAASFIDETPRDSWGRREVEIVAIDAEAFSYRGKKPQFCKESIVRELNKVRTEFNLFFLKKKCSTAFIFRLIVDFIVLEFR